MSLLPTPGANASGPSVPPTPSKAVSAAPEVPDAMTESPWAYEPALAPGLLALNYQTVSTNGSPLTGYLVRYTDVTHPARSGSFTTFADVGYEIYTPRTLTAGDFYFFTMAAENAVGIAAPSPPSRTVQVWTTPGPATDVTAVAGDQSATVSWKLPDFDGYTPLVNGATVIITDLTAQSYTGLPAETSTSTVVGDLINGHSYSFTVDLQNYIEDSASAPSLPVTPSADTVTPPPTPPIPPAPPSPPAPCPPPPVAAPAPRLAISRISLPTRIAVGSGSTAVRFVVWLNRPAGVTVSLMQGTTPLGRTVVSAHGAIARGSMNVRVPARTEPSQLDRWVITATGTGAVLATRPVVVNQASTLTLRAHRLGTSITIIGVARRANHARGGEQRWQGHVIDLQRLTVHGWTTIRVARSGRRGTVTFILKSGPRIELRLADAATTSTAGAVSTAKVL